MKSTADFEVYSDLPQFEEVWGKALDKPAEVPKESLTEFMRLKGVHEV